MLGRKEVSERKKIRGEMERRERGKKDDEPERSYCTRIHHTYHWHMGTQAPPSPQTTAQEEDGFSVLP
jgi:hypothetical protein